MQLLPLDPRTRSHMGRAEGLRQAAALGAALGADAERGAEKRPTSDARYGGRVRGLAKVGSARSPLSVLHD